MQTFQYYQDSLALFEEVYIAPYLKDNEWCKAFIDYYPNQEEVIQ